MVEKMTAKIDLMNNKKMYVVKDGLLIEHDLPNYGEVKLAIHDGKVKYIETYVKKNI